MPIGLICERDNAVRIDERKRFGEIDEVFREASQRPFENHRSTNVTGVFIANGSAGIEEVGVTRLKMGEVMRRLAFQCLSKEILLNQVDSLMIADGRHDIPGCIEAVSYTHLTLPTTLCRSRWSQ